jgi:hypothetical protein
MLSDENGDAPARRLTARTRRALPTAYAMRVSDRRRAGVAGVCEITRRIVRRDDLPASRRSLR